MRALGTYSTEARLPSVSGVSFHFLAPGVLSWHLLLCVLTEFVIRCILPSLPAEPLSVVLKTAMSTLEPSDPC